MLVLSKSKRPVRRFLLLVKNTDDGVVMIHVVGEEHQQRRERVEEAMKQARFEFNIEAQEWINVDELKLSTMKFDLKAELDKFWNWAQISFDDYVSGVFPPVARQPEWEGEYPNWESLEDITEALIIQFNKTQDYNTNDLRDILTVLTIDNESEGLQEFLTMTLTNPRFAHDLIEVSRSFESFHARWQMVEIIKSGQIADKASRLELFIKSDRDQYVRRRALMALSEVNSDLAILYAKIKIKDEDEYMRLAALDILKIDNDYNTE